MNELTKDMRAGVVGQVGHNFVSLISNQRIEVGLLKVHKMQFDVTKLA